MKIASNIFFAEVERLLTESDEVIITIRGNSMRPMLRDGRDGVVLRRYECEPIRVGDVMLFRYRAGHILHRVVRVEGERITFAGDGNYNLYEVAQRGDIVARMVAYVKDGCRYECDGKAWRSFSRVWMALPMIVRRVVLGVMRRLKI